MEQRVSAVISRVFAVTFTFTFTFTFTVTVIVIVISLPFHARNFWVTTFVFDIIWGRGNLAAFFSTLHITVHDMKEKNTNARKLKCSSRACIPLCEQITREGRKGI